MQKKKNKKNKLIETAPGDLGHRVNCIPGEKRTVREGGGPAAKKRGFQRGSPPPVKRHQAEKIGGENAIKGNFLNHISTKGKVI